ncbi:MAG: amidoligase family protein [Bacteroidaceae bacterium]|nr:amidoligase family protein [Bacteroidaceae bacterium]
MRQEVTEVLNQQTSKTAKIIALLQRGLTRREVADLVTGGNYGFVYNVAKKYGLLDCPTQLVGYSTDLGVFDRNFGVEIEAYGCSRTRLAQELRAAGIETQVEGYNHSTRRHWKVVTDSSLDGEQTFELVSPILRGEEGLKELRKVCYVLDYLDIKVNGSCGLHIHMEAIDFDIQTWRNLVLNYLSLERTIDSFMPASRKGNRFCRPLQGSINAQRVERAQSLDELRGIFHNTRYYKLNLEAFDRHHTVEFRQHSGTTNFTKMEHWIRFLNGMINFARQGQRIRTTQSTLDQLPFISDDQKLFYRLRSQKLNQQ